MRLCRDPRGGPPLQPRGVAATTPTGDSLTAALAAPVAPPPLSPLAHSQPSRPYTPSAPLSSSCLRQCPLLALPRQSPIPPPPPAPPPPHMLAIPPPDLGLPTPAQI